MKKLEIYYNLLTLEQQTNYNGRLVDCATNSEGKHVFRTVEEGTDARTLLAEEEGVPEKCIAITSVSISEA